VLKQSASNARALVNGIAVESATNDITGAIDGLTLSLRKTTSSPVNVTVSRDRDAVLAGIKSFVDAYNAVVGFMGEQTKYDAASRTGGPLQGDAVANGLSTQLRSILNAASGASSVFARLSDIGLASQRDGTLTINQTKLDSAVDNNLAELKKAFANSDSATVSNNGFARRFATLASQVLASDGTVNTRTQSLQKQVTKNSDEQTRLGDRVDLFQKRLIAQYTALDANVAKLNALQSYVTQQIAQMNRSTT
jgi:flagellar hook-associated protein 2